jgi:hypothetical protein
MSWARKARSDVPATMNLEKGVPVRKLLNEEKRSCQYAPYAWL